MVEWIKGFIVPLIEITFLLGIICAYFYFVFKAGFRFYTKSFRYFLKYKIFRREYPEETLNWLMECIEKRKGWYEVKKTLMINSVPTRKMNETLWIYDRILKLNEEKGGENHGREFEGSDSEIKSKSEYPRI